ncbi:MAG: hypothetical protein HW376_1221 [candidate division NC10 bacterium]|nr:hypothetical protein [candidate division NC10 bacterium]
MTGALLTVTLVQPFMAQAQVIDERQKRQQERIGEGIKSGELTAKEEIGPKERAKLEQEQDKASKHIYKEKHD